MSYGTNDGLLGLFQIVGLMVVIWSTSALSNVSSPQFLSQVESGDFDSKVKLFIYLFIYFSFFFCPNGSFIFVLKNGQFMSDIT